MEFLRKRIIKFIGIDRLFILFHEIEIKVNEHNKYWEKLFIDGCVKRAIEIKKTNDHLSENSIPVPFEVKIQVIRSCDNCKDKIKL